MQDKKRFYGSFTSRARRRYHALTGWPKVPAIGFALVMTLPMMDEMKALHGQAYAVDTARITIKCADNITGKLIPGNLEIKDSGGTVLLSLHTDGLETINLGYTQVADKASTFPRDYYISRNYPNPFNSETKFTVAVPQAGVAQVSIYDILGREVLTSRSRISPGQYQIAAGGLAAGVYFARTNNGRAIKMVSVNDAGGHPWMRIGGGGATYGSLAKANDSLPDERLIVFSPDEIYRESDTSHGGYQKVENVFILAGDDTLSYDLTRQNFCTIVAINDQGEAVDEAIMSVNGDNIKRTARSGESILLPSSIYILQPANITGAGTFEGKVVSVSSDTLLAYLINAKAITGRVFGVSADSLQQNQLLANAAVWIGNRDINNFMNNILYTDENGRYSLLFSPSESDTLFIQADGYHQRNMLVGASTPITMDQHLITDQIDINFFNHVAFNNGLHGITKPSDKWGNTLPHYFKNPNTTPLDNLYMTQAVVDTLYKFSGKQYRGVVVPDSNNIYGMVEWYKTAGNGEIWFDLNPNDKTIIERVEIGIRRELQPKSLRDATLKEGINIYNFADILSEKVPSTWKNSLWYIGFDSVPQLILPEIDRMAGTIAGRVPRGYEINIIHNKQIE